MLPLDLELCRLLMAVLRATEVQGVTWSFDTFGAQWIGRHPMSSCRVSIWSYAETPELNEALLITISNTAAHVRRSQAIADANLGQRLASIEICADEGIVYAVQHEPIHQRIHRDLDLPAQQELCVVLGVLAIYGMFYPLAWNMRAAIGI